MSVFFSPTLRSMRWFRSLPWIAPNTQCNAPSITCQSGAVNDTDAGRGRNVVGMRERVRGAALGNE